MMADDKKAYLLTGVWLFLLACLTIYSYSQIDLNLTLSSFGPYQFWQQRLIRLGYFHRPTSTALFGILIVSLSVVSYRLVKEVQAGRLLGRRLWCLVGLTILVLLLSYPAFSHDVFNYLFNAKLVTHYRLNPYQYKALDFPADPWTRFMRWTHRPNVYPPVWILISLPATFLGLGKFTVSLLLMKLLMAAFFLLAAVLINRLAGATALALWALNPLVLVESLVSAHNDVVMMALALVAVERLQQKVDLVGIGFALASLGVKFVGGLVTWPFLVKAWSRQGRLKLAWGLAVAFTVGISWRLGFQPWYFLWPLTLAPFFPEKKLLTWLLSLLALSTYLPYLYRGDWGGGVETVRNSFAAVLILFAPWWLMGTKRVGKEGVGGIC